MLLLFGRCVEYFLVLKCCFLWCVESNALCFYYFILFKFYIIFDYHYFNSLIFYMNNNFACSFFIFLFFGVILILLLDHRFWKLTWFNFDFFFKYFKIDCFSISSFKLGYIWKLTWFNFDFFFKYFKIDCFSISSFKLDYRALSFVIFFSFYEVILSYRLVELT